MVLKNLLDKPSGYKTYAAAGGLFLFAVLGLGLGKVDANQAIQLILEGLGLFGLRSALN